MGTTDVKCPECGVMNYSLYLEETEGFMECSCCGCTVQLHRERASVLSGDKQIRWQILGPGRSSARQSDLLFGLP